MIETP